MFDYNQDEMAMASPSVFDAQNNDVKTAINVLKSEADSLNPSMEKELLEAAQKLLETEVL